MQVMDTRTKPRQIWRQQVGNWVSLANSIMIFFFFPSRRKIMRNDSNAASSYIISGSYSAHCIL
jgi:hypothetical protein